MNDIRRSRQGVMDEASMRSTSHVMVRDLINPVTFSSMILNNFKISSMIVSKS